MQEQMKRKTRLVTAREPNGRIQREEREYPPTQIKRLRDAAMTGLRDPEWGTELGRLYLENTITAAMYAAGKRWARDAADYRQAIGVFPIRSAALERGSHGTDPDPDSEEGRRQVEREANGAERFFAAHSALVVAGLGAAHAVRRLCEDNLSLGGMYEMKNVRNGLSALVLHYNLTNQGKST